MPSLRIGKFSIGRLPIYTFYPTALKGCRGIVFTHGVRTGGRAVGRREEVCPACISETINVGS